MSTKFRKSPPVCLMLALFRMITGQLHLSKQYVGDKINTENEKVFIVFRNIKNRCSKAGEKNVVFIVRFKFARLSHRANKIASIIPMLLIAGFPGFIQKIYAVDPENGYWQGMYQWKSESHLQEYKRSFVFRMMNKRAIINSITSSEIANNSLPDYIEKSRINEKQTNKE